tara:strand:+ start:207 stop:479 length:273 start_codon:yes stop_codon:yes gene_type:complete
MEKLLRKKMGKKEPIADLEAHNKKRENDVREQTAKLDDYIVKKYGLKKANSEPNKVEEEKGAIDRKSKETEPSKKNTPIESNKAEQAKKE